jgi:oxygen-independent coproporphyrinogen-3 oxidase
VFIRINDDTLRYTAEQSLLCYFPEEKPEYTTGREDPGAPLAICCCGSHTFTVTIRQHNRRGTGRARISPKEPDPARARRQALGIAFYRAAVDVTGEPRVWGALTGIRPARVIDRLRNNGMTAHEAGAYLRERYHVSAEKTRLAAECAAASRAVEAQLQPEDIGLYVGIPFCPSRCAYCSFVSHAVEKAGKLLPAYLDALETELDAIAENTARNGKRPRALYIGGGTPAILSTGQLDRLLAGIHKRWPCRGGGPYPPAASFEFTVEAGRPDAINQEKLTVMKAHSVNRVSVNPQTMHNAVLQAIGRRHTEDDTVRAVETARRVGFETLNMDLIAGLPGDTPAGLLASLRKVLAWKPENITLHTLARKRGAEGCKRGANPPADPTHTGEHSSPLQETISICHNLLRSAGYAPYYLYRQKFMAAGCENTGWSLPGHDSIYNIIMMEERAGVMAAGAGGVTKLCRAGGRIERVFNPKYPTEYLRDIGDIAARKRNT